MNDEAREKAERRRRRVTKAIEILAAAHDERDANYDRLLKLLADVARGRIEPGRVSVDLQARTYSWVGDEEWAARQAAEREKALRQIVPGTIVTLPNGREVMTAGMMRERLRAEAELAEAQAAFDAKAAGVLRERAAKEGCRQTNGKTAARADGGGGTLRVEGGLDGLRRMAAAEQEAEEAEGGAGGGGEEGA